MAMRATFAKDNRPKARTVLALLDAIVDLLSAEWAVRR